MDINTFTFQSFLNTKKIVLEKRCYFCQSNSFCSEFNPNFGVACRKFTALIGNCASTLDNNYCVYINVGCTACVDIFND